MARKYVNPAKSAPPVDGKLLDEARAKAEVTAAQLREAERGDPLAPSWPAEYEAATAAARAASRRDGRGDAGPGAADPGGEQVRRHRADVRPAGSP